MPTRRHGLAALLALGLGTVAQAQTPDNFPSRPLRIVVPCAAGELEAKAPPDGYTLVLATIAHNGAASMYKGLKYNPSTDLQPVALIAESAGVLIVNPGVPARNAAESERWTRVIQAARIQVD